MSDLFKPSTAEIDAALKGGRPEFTDGEVVQFLVEKVETNKGSDNDATIISAKILTGDNVDMTHGFWFRDNNKGIFFKLMLALFPKDDIVGGKVQPVHLIGKKFQSTAKKSTKTTGTETKVYMNFWEFSDVGGAPAIGGGAPAPTSSAIPF